MRYSVRLLPLFFLSLSLVLKVSLAFAETKGGACSGTSSLNAKTESELQKIFESKIDELKSAKNLKSKITILDRLQKQVQCDLKLTENLNEKSPLRWKLVEIDSLVTTLLETPCHQIKGQIEFNDSQGAHLEKGPLSKMAQTALSIADQICTEKK